MKHSTPAVPVEIANIQIGDVIEMTGGFSGPIHVMIAGPFSYVEYTDPEIFEAWCLKEVNGTYFPDLVTWSSWNKDFTSGAADGALDDMSETEQAEKAKELLKILNLV